MFWLIEVGIVRGKERMSMAGLTARPADLKNTATLPQKRPPQAESRRPQPMRSDIIFASNMERYRGVNFSQARQIFHEHLPGFVCRKNPDESSFAL